MEFAEDHIYDATVKMSSDYYPFGMQMPGRGTTQADYRYGYNGMEMDNEAKGNGNSYTTEFRQYDPRLGRWLSLDPLMMEFPDLSPYVAFDDNPVVYTDQFGLEATADYYDLKTKKKLGSDGINDGKVFYISKELWRDAKLQLGKQKGDPLQAALIYRGASEVTDPGEKYHLGHQKEISAGQAEAQRHYQNNQSKAKVPESSRVSKPLSKLAPGQPTMSRRSLSTIDGERLEAKEKADYARDHMPGFDQFQKIGNGLEVGAPIALTFVGQEYALTWLGNSIRTWKASNSIAVVLGSDAATLANAGRMVPENGMSQLLVHGHPEKFIIDGVITSPKSVAKTILNAGFKRGTPLRVVSCHTGAWSDGAAYQLSRYLKSPILAPTDKVRVLEGGGYEIFGSGIWKQF